MHEFLAMYDNGGSYSECIECNKRTPHICLKCNYCYSCHPKIERIEKEEQANKLIKYLNNTIQQPRQQRLSPATFVTYTITKPKIINKRSKLR
jgi:hypothetical protein